MTAGCCKSVQPGHRTFVLATSLIFPLLALAILASSIPGDAAGPPSQPLLVYSAFDGADVGSLALGPSQEPIISHQRLDQGRFKLALTFCDDLNCGGPTTRIVADGVNHHIGWYSSLALNSSGYPVFSYSDDFPNYDLKLGVCQDATCSISPTLTSIDGQAPAEEVGLYNSLALTGSDLPRIAYYDQTNGQVKLAVCQDPGCGVTPTLRAIGAASALPLSLALDHQELPRIAYVSAGGLELAVCSDATCAITPTLNTIPISATDVSLALNSLGNPVIASVANNSLQLFICEDPSCTVRTQRNLGSAASSFTGIRHLWLALDENDRPVISFQDATFGILKVAVCRQRLCGRASVHLVDGTNSGRWSALALAEGSVPVVAHQNSAEADVVLSVCYVCIVPTVNQVDSTEANGVVAMALNSNDHPVLSYRTQSYHLKLAFCQDHACANATFRTFPSFRAASLALDDGDKPVLSYYHNATGTVNLAICNDVTCTSPLTRTIGNAVVSGGVQMLALNSSDYAVLSFGTFGITNTLELAVCNDALCSNPTLTTVNPNGAFGHRSALALRSDDIPVIAYRDQVGLKLAICNDLICSNPVTRSLDTEVAFSSPEISLALDDDVPVVSYLGGSAGLKLAVCADVDCTSATIVRPSFLQHYVSQNYGWSTWVALTADGRPVISYHDRKSDRVWLAVCTTLTCARLDDGGIERPAYGQIEVHDLLGGATGWQGYTALALDSRGAPVVAFWGQFLKRLEVASFELPQPGSTTAYLPLVLGQ